VNATTTEEGAAKWLMTPEAIRARSEAITEVGLRGGLRNFALDLERLESTADVVVATIRQNYPTFEIPYHSRWRHFSVGGRDRWAHLAEELCVDREERARVQFDLAVVSVLLDAGAGDDWRYREPASGEVYCRSEGLAVASFDMFVAGLFSAHADQPLRVDAAALCALTDRALAAGLQVSAKNPLAGLDGRGDLLRRLGKALAQQPGLFGKDAPRVGHLFDYLKRQAEGGRLPARAILAAVLEGLGPIWPGRITLGGVNLGDTWRHPAAGGEGPSRGLVPFHKLSQWLTYSLIEPLEEAAVRVEGLESLTALAEYRNGGLLVDMGLLVPKNPVVTASAHEPGSEVIVEWRALTVTLIDRLAERVRGKLDLDATAMPLPKILQGGTWAAGRRIARQLRAGGGPPIRLISDGAVF
jgi:hypothetical protein